MKQAELLSRTIAILERIGIPYMVVGSVASSTYGDPRMTRDIDIVVDLDEASAQQLCDAFPPDDYYVSREAALDATLHRTQFNVLHPDSANKIDFMVAGHDAWGREQVRRRQRVLILPDTEGFAASPEDIILSKMRYYQEGGSEKHLRDISSMLTISRDRIDRAYIERWAATLGVTQIWRDILADLGEC